MYSAITYLHRRYHLKFTETIQITQITQKVNEKYKTTFFSAMPNLEAVL